MTDQPKSKAEELDGEEGALLEDREVMSVVRVLPEPDPPLLEPDPKTYEASPEDPPPGT